MTAVAFSLQGLWWLPVIAVALGLLAWQRRRLAMSPLRWTAFSLLLLALVNPLVMVRRDTAEKADFNLKLVKPRILLVEQGNGKTFLGNVLGGGTLNHVDVVTPEQLPMVSDMAKRYDIVFMHTTKNLQVYTDFFTDWRSFPNRGKLESIFTDYGVVFDNGTNTLPQELDNYGLVVLAGADIKAGDADRLLEYVGRGGRLLIFFHAGGGLAINGSGNENPYCILYHHPPYGDKPFPADWLQRNVATMLRDSLGVRSMENISCIYGNTVVRKSDLSALHNIYGEGKLFPNVNTDGKGFDKLDWTTAFLDYDPAWQPVLSIDTKVSGGPTGHGTPIPVPIQGKPAAMARQYGSGKVFVFGLGPVNYGRNGFPPSLLLGSAPYIGADLVYNDATSQALMNYVAEGGNLVMVGPSIPKSNGKVKLADLLPVNPSGPQIAEATKVVFRNQSHPILEGLAPFAISHYRVASGKATGEVLAADGKNNPALVTSYYGLGKVVYYLPEIPVQVNGDNTAPAEFWRRLTAWLSPTETAPPAFTTGFPLQSGGQIPVSLRVWDDDGKPVEKAEVSAGYISPDGHSATEAMKERSDGNYVGQLSLTGPGDYRVWFNVKSGTATKTPPVNVTAGPPGPGAMGQKAWQAITFLNGYHGTVPDVAPLPVWQLLVLVSMCLFCVDWVRKLSRGHP